VTGQGGARKGIVRQALTENIGLKLLALAASIGLFVIVRGTEDIQGVVNVDVVALLPEPETQRMLISEIPDEVRVTLRGSGSVLNTIRREGLPPLTMDLRNASEHFYYFEPGALELPAGVQIVQIAPSAVPLTWVDRADRRVRVEAALEGEPADGHIVTSATVDPTHVVVRGAASEVNRLEVVRTAPVDISGLREGHHERRVPLGPLPPHVTYVETVSVVVTVEIAEEQGTRVLSDLEVSITGSTVVRARPERIAVTLSGPRAALDALDPSHVVPTADGASLEAARGAQPVRIQLRGVPEGVTAVAQPNEVLLVPAPR
jgi:YbbR domain-containing protein